MTLAPSRRRLLAAAPAALLLSPIASAKAVDAVLASADADLVALHDVASRAFQAYGVSASSVAHLLPSEDPARHAEAQAEQAAAWYAYETALEAMAEIPASGLAGLAAKVSATTAFDADFLDPDDAEQVMLASAAEDAARFLLALGLPAAAPLPRDGRLLALTEQWVALTDEAESHFAATGSDPERQQQQRERFRDRGRLGGFPPVPEAESTPGLPNLYRPQNYRPPGAVAPGGPLGDVRVRVEFDQVPRGTRVNAESSGRAVTELDVGFATLGAT